MLIGLNFTDLVFFMLFVGIAWSILSAFGVYRRTSKVILLGCLVIASYTLFFPHLFTPGGILINETYNSSYNGYNGSAQTWQISSPVTSVSSDSAGTITATSAGTPDWLIGLIIALVILAGIGYLYWEVVINEKKIVWKKPKKEK